MKQLQIKVDTISLPVDYSGFAVTEPTLVVLSDGCSAFKATTSFYCWFPKDTTDYLLRLLEAQQPDSAPQPQVSVSSGIDNITLLKAIAIAQQPELAMNLLKD